MRLKSTKIETGRAEIKLSDKINMIFINNSGLQIGRFFENENGKLHFEGDVSESAEHFIKFVKETFNKS